MDIVEIIDNLIFTRLINTKLPNVYIYYSLVIYIIVLLVSIFTLIKSYKFYNASTDLKSIFKSLLFIMIAFSVTSFLYILDTLIFYISSQQIKLVFLIPFLPVFFILYGSREIVDQIIHRSKKKRPTFRIISSFIDFSLLIYLLVIVVMVFGFYIDPTSKIPLYLAILGFFVNESVFILLIVFIQRQKSELSSYVSKIRLTNVQLGYFGFIIYFLTLVVIYETNSAFTIFIFLNVKLVASFMIILFYYWSIILPNWMEKQV